MHANIIVNNDARRTSSPCRASSMANKSDGSIMEPFVKSKYHLQLLEIRGFDDGKNALHVLLKI